jgi:hypothetical protein
MRSMAELVSGKAVNLPDGRRARIHAYDDGEMRPDSTCCGLSAAWRRTSPSLGRDRYERFA